MSAPNDPQLTLVSTTDPIEAVQAALGVTPDPAATAAATQVAQTPKVETPVTEPPVVEPPVATETPVVAAAVAEPLKPGGKPRDKGNSLQGRIDELVRERDTARGMTAAHEAELTALRAKVSELAGPATPKVEADPVAEQPKPKVEDFPDYDAYVEASIVYHSDKIADKKVREALAAKATSEAENQNQRQVNELLQKHESRVAAAKERYDDFHAAVGKPDVQISTVMRDAIVISDVGPDVAYYLANHPEEREAIAALGNTPQAMRMMGKLEQKVETELASKSGAAASAPASTPAVSTTPALAASAAAAPTGVPAATRAPDPITPLGGGNVVTTVRPDQMSFADYKKYREEQQRQKVGAR